MICTLTEHIIVLSQAEPFDVLDLYKTRTQDALPFVLFWVHCWKTYIGLIKIHLYLQGPFQLKNVYLKPNYYEKCHTTISSNVMLTTKIVFTVHLLASDGKRNCISFPQLR